MIKFVRRNLLFVGPVSGVVTGQSKSFGGIVNEFANSIVVDSFFKSYMDVFTFWLKLILGFVCSKNIVYFTSSRSRRGFYSRDFAIFLLAWLFERKLINHLHGNDFNEFRNSLSKFERAILDFFYKKIDIAILPGRSLICHYDRYVNTRCVTINNCFSSMFFDIDVSKSAANCIELLFFSNFICSKGFKLVCEATIRLRESGFQVNLALCGSVIDSDCTSVHDTNDYLHSLSAYDFIKYHGAVDGRIKIDVLTKSHIMILPTTYPTEAFPISLVEGLASGCFVISTDHGCIAELVEGFHARLIAPNVDEIMASVIEYSTIIDRNAIAYYNRKRALEKYSPVQYFSKIAGLLS